MGMGESFDASTTNTLEPFFLLCSRIYRENVYRVRVVARTGRLWISDL